MRKRVILVATVIMSVTGGASTLAGEPHRAPASSTTSSIIQSTCDELTFTISTYRTEQPQALISGDWDKNGTIDIAQADIFLFTSTPVQMLLNDGTGSFTFRTSCSFPFRSANFDLVVGDFDNDDTLDVVLPHVGTAFPGPNAVRIMKGTSRSGCIFQYTGFLFATGTDEPRAIAAGDFNTDGLLDVAVVGIASNTAGVLLNTGPTMSSPINFDAPIDFTAGSAPRDIATGDFNGDSKLDLAVAASGEDSVKVFPGWVMGRSHRRSQWR